MNNLPKFHPEFIPKVCELLLEVKKVSPKEYSFCIEHDVGRNDVQKIRRKMYDILWNKGLVSHPMYTSSIDEGGKVSGIILTILGQEFLDYHYKC